ATSCMRGIPMPHELVPEFHDALKLTTLKHNFEDFGPYSSQAPNTRSWRGVCQHHCEERFPEYPSDRDTFLLHMADGLAAGFSRHPQNIRHDTQWTVHRLWNPSQKITDERLVDPPQIAAMLRYLAEGDPDFERFFERYRHIFQTRAEDAHPGMNITTLETHVRLVGRFYRFLRNARMVSVTDEEVERAASRGFEAVARLREQKKREWHLHTIRCRIQMLISPFRARDMNAFECLGQFLQQVRRQLADNLLFSDAEELLLYSDDMTVLDEISRLAAPANIAFEVSSDRQRLDEFGLRFRQPAPQALYPELAPSIAPPLCEICQMRAAVRLWPDDYLAGLGQGAEELSGEGRDYLCEPCFSVRSRPSRLVKLAHWEEWAQGDIVWVRFGLDLDRLQAALGELYWRYLKSLDSNTSRAAAQVRLSLVAEFQSDYDVYERRLGENLIARFGADRIETILPGFFAIRAEAGADVFGVLTCLAEVVREFFPAFFDLAEAPLRVSLALCDVKYPFFEVWRGWQAQQSEIEITAIGQGGVPLRLSQLEKFLKLADFPFRQSALHNLAEIARISQSLAELRFRAGGERGERETYERLNEFLPLELGFNSILTLAKLRQ
ncbi:MAG: hypothetical protein ACRD2O_04185, partial [Terriglobia bacterium]